MATWAGPYNCTDCGRDMDHAGTCNDCKVAHQAATEKVKRDLEKADRGGKGK